jgi:hypothetical protein
MPSVRAHDHPLSLKKRGVWLLSLASSILEELSALFSDRIANPDRDHTVGAKLRVSFYHIDRSPPASA